MAYCVRDWQNGSLCVFEKLFQIAFLVWGLNCLQVTSRFVWICLDLSGFVVFCREKSVRGSWVKVVSTQGLISKLR
jgi:hypothetical protein